MKTPLYSVGTWDMDLQAYTPQAGLTVPSQNVDIHGLRKVLKQLRNMGYPCHRFRNADGSRDSDWAVLVERTDGRTLSDHVAEAKFRQAAQVANGGR